MNFKFRKSVAAEDSIEVARWLKANINISPYSQRDLIDLIKSGVRAGEISLVKKGVSSEIIDPDKWFFERVKPNTVSISKKMYIQALYRAFRLIVLGNIAKIDFRYARQRDFGQLLTDFTRGFLGEIVLEQFLHQRFGLKVDLEEKQIGKAEQFLATDVPYIWEGDKRRKSKLNFSLKTSKLPSMWLDISSSQISYSDIFCFIKVGLKSDHFMSFMKEAGFVERLVEIAVEAGEIPKDSSNEELKLLLNKIPEIMSWPAYVAGFVEREEFKIGKLTITSTKLKKRVAGGFGYYSGREADSVEGLMEISGDRYLASCGALRWRQTDWDQLIKRM